MKKEASKIGEAATTDDATRTRRRDARERASEFGWSACSPRSIVTPQHACTNSGISINDLAIDWSSCCRPSGGLIQRPNNQCFRATGVVMIHHSIIPSFHARTHPRMDGKTTNRPSFASSPSSIHPIDRTRIRRGEEAQRRPQQQQSSAQVSPTHSADTDTDQPTSPSPPFR